MKLLSIAIPCYNSQDYMRHAIETLLAGGEDVEILVVNDGSKDKTADIAAEYQQKYPTIVRAINKENGGHGDAVMTGLKNATGLYFKVVDSDDWVDEECLKRVLAQLRAFTEQKEEIDMLICNYVYDKVGVKHKHVMQYRHAVPQNRVFDWNETRFKIGEYLHMVHDVDKIGVLFFFYNLLNQPEVFFLLSGVRRMTIKIFVENIHSLEQTDFRIQRCRKLNAG